MQIRVFEKSPFTKKHKKTRKCKFAFMKSYLFTKTLIAQKPLIREHSNHRQKLQNVFLHEDHKEIEHPHAAPKSPEVFSIGLWRKWETFISHRGLKKSKNVFRFFSGLELLFFAQLQCSYFFMIYPNLMSKLMIPYFEILLLSRKKLKNVFRFFEPR